MKNFFFVLFTTLTGIGLGLLHRPSFMFGQVDSMKVMTKGMMLGSVEKFFFQRYIDQSFYHVLMYAAGGALTGLLIVWFFKGNGKSSKSSTKKKKA